MITAITTDQPRLCMTAVTASRGTVSQRSERPSTVAMDCTVHLLPCDCTIH